MILSKAFDKFVEETPVCVMIRGSLEFALSDQFINQIFETTAQRQYTRELLFSDVVDVMGSVVFQVFPSVNAAYQKQQDRFTVSRRALYDKINLIEPGVTRQLVVETSRRMAPVVRSLRRMFKGQDLLPGFRVRILDGNHLAASEHRIQELRDIAAGPLPGQTLVVFDPDTRLVVDAFPCQDGHAQERSLLMEVLDSMQAGEVWMGDRNFCTSLFLFQTAANDAYFVIRQHATNVRWEAAGPHRKVGRTETGMVYQQRVDLIDDWGHRLKVRRITIKLDQPTEDGQTEIHILTNLPNRVKATRIAEAYRGRWKLEAAFGELATALHCEIGSLGYPPAALFAFGIGLVAYNILSVVRTALAAAHGASCLDDISAYYVADEMRGMMRGMMVAIGTDRWQRQFGKLSARQMANLLVALAQRVKLERFRKHRRGPKKPRPKRTRFKGKSHVSTARILAESRGKDSYLQ
ncbi:MAG: transposase [Pseudomonas sp.]|uniref:transposase n=1 Tax=Pseudomonas sp. TaxID=306 RepID=UPI003C70C564